jgi:hypothetical protein
VVERSSVVLDFHFFACFVFVFAPAVSAALFAHAVLAGAALAVVNVRALAVATHLLHVRHRGLESPSLLRTHVVDSRRLLRLLSVNHLRLTWVTHLLLLWVTHLWLLARVTHLRLLWVTHLRLLARVAHLGLLLRIAHLRLLRIAHLGLLARVLLLGRILLGRVLLLRRILLLLGRILLLGWVLLLRRVLLLLRVAHLRLLLVEMGLGSRRVNHGSRAVRVADRWRNELLVGVDLHEGLAVWVPL